MFFGSVNQSFEEIIMKKDDVVIIFTKWIAIKGRRVYAGKRGKKAFCLEIPREKSGKTFPLTSAITILTQLRAKLPM
jgi:hypothetical protein